MIMRKTPYSGFDLAGLVRRELSSRYRNLEENPQEKENSRKVQFKEFGYPISVPLFEGIPNGHRVFRQTSTLPNTREYKWRWVVLSRGKQSKTVRFLFAKWLWDELTLVEMWFLLDTAEFQNSEFLIDCFRISRELGKKELRKVLEKLDLILVLPYPVTRRQYKSLQSMGVSISVEYVPVPSYAPFSGWVRHHRKSSARIGSIPIWDTNRLDPDFDDTGFFWYDLLSVAVSSQDLGGTISRLMSPAWTKRRMK